MPDKPKTTTKTTKRPTKPEAARRDGKPPGRDTPETRRETGKAEVRLARAPRAARPAALITGATGFLGAHLVRELVRRGEGPLRAMQSGPPPAWLTELGVEVVRGSVTSEAD